jgi:MYXO-CTERM domain-containing protein
MWIDGANVLPKKMTSNKYPGMQNYLLIGLYRNGHIGDPNLLYPDGSHVYGTDGTPGVAYVDGFIAGRTRESVLDSQQPPAPDPTTTTSPGSGSGSTPPLSGSTSTPGSSAPAIPTKIAGAFPQGGGCSSTGLQSAWLALPLLGLFALRRRKPVIA